MILYFHAAYVTIERLLPLTLGTPDVQSYINYVVFACHVGAPVDLELLGDLGRTGTSVAIDGEESKQINSESMIENKEE